MFTIGIRLTNVFFATWPQSNKNNFGYVIKGKLEMEPNKQCPECGGWELGDGT